MKKVFVLVVAIGFSVFCAAQYSYPTSLFEKAKANNGWVDISWPEIGAVPNDKIDDLPKVNSALNFCIQYGYNLQFPDGVTRITNTAMAGYDFIHDSDVLKGNIYVASKFASFNNSKYLNVIYKQQIKIRGTGRSVLFADFESDVPKSVILYALKGNKNVRTNLEQENGEISNLVICTRSYIDSLNGLPFPVLNTLPKSKLIGITALMSYGIDINNVTFHGVDRGIVINECYGAVVSQCKFKWNNVGFENIRSTPTTYENCVTESCRTGLVIRSEKTTLLSFFSEHCGTALHINAGDVMALNGYLECTQSISLGFGANPQLIIGADSGQENYANKAILDGIVLAGLTITIPGLNDKALGIRFGYTAKDVTFMGGRAMSIGLIKYTNKETRVSLINFNSNNFPTEMVKTRI